MRTLRCASGAATSAAAVRPARRATMAAMAPPPAAAAPRLRAPALASRRCVAAAMPPVCAHSIGVLHDEDSDDEDTPAANSSHAPPPPPGCRWRRVMLKISGEALAGEAGFGIDADLVLKFAKEVAAMALEGVQVAIVVGGGNFFRGKEREGKGLDRASADYMGMLATVMNALQLQAALESVGVPVRVQTAIDMKEVAEPYIRRRAMRHLEKGRVVIFGAGTGNPFFTTDTGAALRAAEINAQALLKATKVDGVFDSDPKRNPAAKLHTHLSYADVITNQDLGAMDTTAVTLCAENSIPVVVFNLFTEGNIKRAVRGENVGTRIGEPWAPITGAAKGLGHGGEEVTRCDVAPGGAAAAKAPGGRASRGAAAAARAHR